MRLLNLGRNFATFGRGMTRRSLCEMVDHAVHNEKARGRGQSGQCHDKADQEVMGDNGSMEQRAHCPVMVSEVLDMLQPQPGQVFLDMTFGAGGHSEAILQSSPDTKIYALDRDPLAFELARDLSKRYQGRVIPMLGRFSDTDQLLTRLGLNPGSLDGILFDLGASSMQMDNPSRGFGLSRDGPLDMRMDAERVPNQVRAMDVVNGLDERGLTRIFKTYGDEKMALVIARAIVQSRFEMQHITTTAQLAALVDAVFDQIGCHFRVDKLGRRSHTATKVFQALRIFVNNELNELNVGIELASHWLRTGGRLAALSFHSLEDRIVKRHLAGIDMDECITSGGHSAQRYKNAGVSLAAEEVNAIYSHQWTPLAKRVIVPQPQEVASNPRSRSAKLRGAINNGPASV